MSLDGTVLCSIKNHLHEAILDGRIGKIHQPKNNNIVITINKIKRNLQLFLSNNPSEPRINLTVNNYENPKTPPSFCMVLRKHLSHGRITEITQPNYDRILYIDIEKKDELGFLKTKRLIVEIMGKHSNIILVEQNTSIIIDSIKRITSSTSSYRQILPGIKYTYPPSNNKQNPLKRNKYFFAESIKKSSSNIEKFFISSYTGISPLMSKEIIYRAGLEPDKLCNNLNNNEILRLWYFFDLLFLKIENKNFQPIIYCKDNSPVNYYALKLISMNTCEEINYQNISEAIDMFYSLKHTNQKIYQIRRNIENYINNQLEKESKKLNIYYNKLKSSLKAEQYKNLGELITANIYRIKKGMESINLKNYYNQNEIIEISLNPKLTPSQNAQQYFNIYNKLKRTKKSMTQRIQITEKEIDYLESILLFVKYSENADDILDIKNELYKNGYIINNKITINKKESKVKPKKFLSSDGFLILAGKNNHQNDYITMKMSAPGDLWFHVKDAPGSHILIKKDDKKEFTSTCIFEAACLAVNYSKNKHSSNVPVDYTEKKHVKKPKGSKPGMVIYTNYKTVFITPEEKILKRIRIAN